MRSARARLDSLGLRGSPPAILVALLASGIAPAPAFPQGLSPFHLQLWHQDAAGIAGTAEEDDFFGQAVAAGDFDGDGFDDLAIGVPYEDLFVAGVGDIDAAGAVHVLSGGAGGLGAADSQLWTQDSTEIEDQVERFDRFGAALAAGDFNGDGYDDLAIGALVEELDGEQGAGAVHVLYGSAAGLSAFGDQLWSQADPLILGDAETGDHFGAALAAGDFDGDGYDDLALGAPEDGHLDPFSQDGAIHALYGSAIGLTAEGSQSWRGRDFAATAEDFCGFGRALTAGDFDADGYDDLAVGAPLDNFAGLANVGSVRVLFGSALGLTTARDLLLLGPEENGHQGESLAAGDFDGDGDDDLAIGIPLRTVGGQADAGAVAVRLGDGGELLDGGEWSQDSAGVQGVAEASDHFGEALVSGDSDGDGRADLAVGAPLERVEDFGEGAVNVLFGSAGGLTATGDQLWYADLLPLADPSASDLLDHFGEALASGDFDGNGHADLAVGTPGEALTTPGGAGAVYVLHGSLFADDFESEDTTAWSDAFP